MDEVSWASLTKVKLFIGNPRLSSRCEFKERNKKMKPVFASNILLSIVLPLCDNFSAQENGHTQTDNSKKQIKMSVTQTPEKNKEAVRMLYEDIFNTGKLELLNQIIAEEYTGISGQKGPLAFAEPIKQLRQSFPDIQWTIED